MITHDQPQLVAREPLTADEMEAMFRLRYQQFRAIDLIDENVNRLDIDYFDQTSCFVCLFSEQGPVTELIGCMRMVTTEPTRFLPLVQEVAHSTAFFQQKLSEKPEKPLPMLNYVPFAEAMESFYSGYQSSGIKLMEGSRLCVQRSITGLKSMPFIMEVAIAISWHLGCTTWLAACDIRHEKLYQPLGFRQIRGAKQFDYRHRTALAMFSSLGLLPLNTSHRIEFIKKAFETDGEVILPEGARHDTLKAFKTLQP